MGLVFRSVTAAPLEDFSAAAPDGVVIGIIGEEASGASTLLRVAGGVERARGAVEAPEPRRYIGPGDALNLAPTRLLLLDHALARHDMLVRERAAVSLERLRRSGATVLLASHEEELLRRLADEIWWLRDGKLAGRGGPEEMLRAYRAHIAARVRAWGDTVAAPPSPRVRRGDGRAEIAGIEILGESGRSTMVLRSGELAVIRVAIRFRDAVEDPVAGILIRTRIGLNVYGTNTELERLKLGPRVAGDTLHVTFAFRCELCPQEYNLTVASHDPDGIWHDWLEDAVAFTVTDTRYTAGVANLRATATVSGPE